MIGHRIWFNYKMFRAFKNPRLESLWKALKIRFGGKQYIYSRQYRKIMKEKRNART